MIERQFVAQNVKEFQIQEYIRENLSKVGLSHTKLQRTPLGEKITIYASHPGLVVGKSGENIKRLTFALKKKFGLENPQIEIAEVDNINLDPQIVAERMASSLERFGSSKFKGVMHKAMDDVLKAGAMGVEIVLSGKVPSTRAKSWRIKGGHIKKCGDIATSYVLKAKVEALLKTGMIGIQVKIMPPGTKLPDAFKVLSPEDIKGEVEDITLEVKSKETKSKSKSKKAKAETEEKDGESEAVKEIKEKIQKKVPKKKEEKSE